MTRKRSKLEIYLAVLRTIKQGVEKPTNIMYGCNLAYKPFKRILEALVNSGLVNAVDKGNRKIYKLTQKGQEVIRNFEMAEAVLTGLRGHKKVNNSAY